MFSLHALVIYSLLTMATTLHVCRLITWLKEEQVKAWRLIDTLQMALLYDRNV